MIFLDILFTTTCIFGGLAVLSTIMGLGFAAFDEDCAEFFAVALVFVVLMLWPITIPALCVVGLVKIIRKKSGR